MKKERDTDVFQTGWENPPSLSNLKADLESSKSVHDAQISKVNEWKEKLKARPHNSKAGRSKVQPKLIRKNNEWRYTSLTEPFLNTPDFFKVEPVTANDVKSAKQNELILNNQMNTYIDKVTFIDSYVRKVTDEGTVVVRLGWASGSEMVDREYPIYEVRPTQEQKHITDLEKARNQDPKMLGQEMLEALIETEHTGIPHYPFYTGTEVVEDEEILYNHPTLEVCDIENLVIDPSCNGDLDNAQFVIHSFETSKSDLEKAGIYQNLDLLENTAPDPIDDAEHSSNWAYSGFSFSDEPRKKIVAYEYWGYWDVDGSGSTRPIVVTWVGNTIIRMAENPYPDKKVPFVSVPYLPVDKEIYGEPDGELLSDNQDIVGAVTRGIIDMMGRSANSQTGVKKGALDSINMMKFKRGDDYEFNDVGDAQQSIYMHTFPEIPASAYNMINMQQQEAEGLTGVRIFGQGITGKGLGDTAAAANGALDAAARRELGILRRLANGMRKIGRKMIAMNQVFLSDVEVVRITDERFETVKRDDLAGKFDLRLSISTAEADEQKAKELSFMLQTTGQNFGLEMYKLILSEIAELRKMPELAHKLRNYKQEPSQKEQLEAQKLELEIQEQQLKNEKIKAEIEKIRAESLGKTADAERKRIDSYEQSQGITHARELERNKAQAEGNMDLKAFEFALKNQEELSQPDSEPLTPEE